MKAAGGNIIGVDWRVELGHAWKRLGYNVGIQGNLDPVTLLAPTAMIKERVKKILQSAENRPGHIFNLGHGILPQTPLKNVVALINMVHDLSKR
jgi:uroporphyrinogen decarboxylase